MAWLTLAVAPVCVVLFIEYKFLPYHSAIVTTTHRMLVVVDLLAILRLWPMALYAAKDSVWRTLIRRASTLITAAVGITMSIGAIGISIIPMSFPGEPHASWSRYYDSTAYSQTDEQRTCQQVSYVFPQNFDRIHLPRFDAVDDDWFLKAEAVSNNRGQRPFEAERSKDLSWRDFRCAILTSADLRYVNFSYSILSGADLERTELRGADFQNAALKGVNLRLAQLAYARFSSADLEQAYFNSAHGERALFVGAMLWGADLSEAYMQGAQFDGAQMQKAKLGGDFRGANFAALFFGETNMQAADLSNGNFQGARLSGVKLQAANISDADLRAAVLENTQLQGASFAGSDLGLALFVDVYVWRTRIADCHHGNIVRPKLDPVLDRNWNDEEGRGSGQFLEVDGKTLEEIANYINRTVSEIPDRLREPVKNILSEALMVGDANGHQQMQDWHDCATKSENSLAAIEKRVAHLLELVCSGGEADRFILGGIYDIWIEFPPAGQDTSGQHAKLLARGLLSSDSKRCPSVGTLESSQIADLKRLASE